MSNIEYWDQNILFLLGVFLWSKILPLDSKIKGRATSTKYFLKKKNPQSSSL
jgi:hypothetical protein